MRHVERALLSMSMVGSLLVGLPATPAAAAALKPGLPPVPEVTTPPAGAVHVPLGPSLAARPLERHTPVRAPEVTIPAGPTLVNQVEQEAASRVREAGFASGRPAVHDLLPDTGQAATLTLTRPPTGALGLLGKQVKNVPLLTYRLCAQSAELAVACSLPQPLVKPVAADVTGDGTPDLVADLVPSSASGLAFGVKRLSSAGELKAQVWAEYEVPSVGTVSIGLDGYKRGSSLSGFEWGVYTVSKGEVKVEVRRSSPGSSVATIAALNGTLVSLRQSPAPERFTARARFGAGKLEVTGSEAARLDGLVVSGSQFTQVSVDKVGKRMVVELAKPMAVRFTGSGPVGRAELHSYGFRDGVLARAVDVAITRMPAAFRVDYAKQALTVTSGAPRAEKARVRSFDRAAGKTVLRADLAGLPARVRLENDLAAHRIKHTASSAIGSFAAILQRNEGAIASPRGGHVTMIKKGDQVGVSGRLNGLSGFDVTYGSAPHALLHLDAGGSSFLGAASIDETHVARLEISNTPATIDVTLDPSARKAKYLASGVIDKLRAGYSNEKTGLAVDGTLHGIRSRVAASWELGERSTVDVTSSATLKKIAFQASRPAATRTGTGTSTDTGAGAVAPGGVDRKTEASSAALETVRATVTGVRKRLAVVVDSGAGTLAWTADHPVTAVDAVARAAVQGRMFTAAARVTGVPARFEARWGPGGYRFNGTSGPLGAATIAVTNHEGAKAPTGPHLAAHYNATTGDLDTSVRVRGLKDVAFTPTAGCAAGVKDAAAGGTAGLKGAAAGYTADFRAAKQKLALDADVLLADGLRVGALGRLGPVPGRITIASDGGPITYTSDTPLDLKARLWLGKEAALAATAEAPGVAGGVSLVHAGGAVRAFLDVTGLPTTVTVDPARKTFTFAGYRPRHRTLRLFLDSAPVKATATLTGLPTSITKLTVGPFDVTAANAVSAAYRVEPAATLGSLRVHAQSGAVRGEIAVSPVPAAVSVSGSYGQRTSIRVANSAPVKRLSAAVTVAGAGTGVVRFGDVPARFGLDADTTTGGLQMPALTYKSDANTLDGFFGVEGGLIAQVFKPAQGQLRDASFAVTDLAGNTTVRIQPDLSIELASKPVPTKRLEAHAGLTLAPIAPQPILVRKEIPNTNGFVGYELGGGFGLGQSSIDDLSIAVHGLSWLKIRPGKVPFGVKAPPALGYVSPGFEGAYTRLDLRASGVNLNPDVTLDAKVTRKLGAAVFKDTVRLGPARTLQLRRYDQQMRVLGAKQVIRTGDLPVACVTLGTKPGLAAAKGTNAISLRGADGPQLVSLLDPGGQTPDYVIDLLAHFMSPFPGADWKVSDVSAGDCHKS